jgi:death-on-curing protein
VITDPVFPPLRAIVDLHAELLEEHGGAPGVHNEGALEAALARPHQLLASAEQRNVTLFDLAAALCFGIVRIHHPFVDGNKRAGFMALLVTLELNGFYLDVTEHEATEVMLSVAAGAMSEASLAGWIERNAFPEPRPEA